MQDIPLDDPGSFGAKAGAGRTPRGAESVKKVNGRPVRQPLSG
jgi:hypothetical protein